MKLQRAAVLASPETALAAPVEGPFRGMVPVGPDRFPQPPGQPLEQRPVEWRGCEILLVPDAQERGSQPRVREIDLAVWKRKLPKIPKMVWLKALALPTPITSSKTPPRPLRETTG